MATVYLYYAAAFPSSTFMNFLNRSGQIAIEFLLLVGVGLFLLLVALITITHVSADKIDEKTYQELDDFGLALHQELILASEMEDGYTRTIDIPLTVNGRNFALRSNPITNETTMLTITFETLNLTYIVPPFQGDLLKGKNSIHYLNATLIITHP